MIDWAEAKKLIGKHSRFLITTHINPDGDAIGTELAMASVLRSIGKEARIVNDQPTPRRYEFLDPQNEGISHLPDVTRNLLDWCDAVVVVDTGVWMRLGPVGELIRESKRPLLCIDHHPSNDGIGSVNIIDVNTSSVGEMVYLLAKELGVKVDQKTADALFVAIATDTGWFRFPNTTACVFEFCAELKNLGADPSRLYSQMYESFRWERMSLLSLALSTLSSECGGKIALIKITRDMFKQSGADEQDVEGFVDLVRCTKGVEVVLLFREGTDGQTKVSLRSKGNADVRVIATHFGGGGHPKASGIRFACSLEKAIGDVVAVASKHLRDLGI